MKKDGGPAFPTGDGDGLHGIAPYSNGMSLRQYYAGQAMMGIMSNGNMIDNDKSQSVIWASSLAVRCADALIAELEKE